MARHGLTIQKKFAILFLIVGLLPAVLGVAGMIVGSRLAFASAKGGDLETNASKIARSVTESGQRLYTEMLRALAAVGGEPERVTEVAQGLRGFAALAWYDGSGLPEVDPLSADFTDVAERLTRSAGFFSATYKDPLITEQGYVTDVRLESIGGQPALKLAALAYRRPDGTVVYFFTTGDQIVRELRAATNEDFDEIYLYSRRGYMLTSAPAPEALLDHSRKSFDQDVSSLPGWFSVRWRESKRTRWHLVGYSVLPGFLSLVEAGRTNSPWIVLVSYDMERFMGPQSRIVWASVFVALAWAFLVLCVSIFATRRVVGPVKSLRTQAEALTAGNLDANVSVTTHDEISDLADAFNTMAGRLRESYGRVEARSEQMRLHAEHINVINEITKGITQALDLDRTFEILRRDLRKAIHFDGMWIALLKKETGKLEVTHAEPADLMDPLRRGEAPLEFSFHGRAMRERAASRGLIGPMDDSDVFESGVYRNLGFASYLVAPLPGLEGVFGTLTLVSRRPEPFGEEETAIAASVASAVAVGIEQAELFSRTRRFAEELEQRIRERTRDLARANQKLVMTEKYHAVGRLAGNLAHEINNPLGIIKNYLKIVTRSLADTGGGRRRTDPNLDNLRVMNEEIDRIARIVRQLLDLHRPPEQSAQETDICALLSDLVALLEKEFSERKIQFRCEFQPDLPRPLVAPDLIRQVFINLMRNAEHAMPDGGELSIKCQSRMQFDGEDYQHVICASFTDTGTGIKPEHMDMIFDPFFTTKPSDKGTGLGLSVSYGVIQMYEGTIEVQSEEGKGTTFTVTLPVEPPPKHEAPIASSEGPSRPAAVAN